MDIMNPVGAIADIGLGIGNLVMQNKNLKYQKEVQQKTWDREDTATQRRVEDLKAAGLSPTLAAGSAAQVSAPIQTYAPQYEGPSLQDKAANYLAMTKMKSEVGVTKAQERIAQAQAAVAEHDAKIDLQTPVKSEMNNGLYGYYKVFNNTPLGNQLINAMGSMYKDSPVEKFLKSVRNDSVSPALSAIVDKGNATKRDEYKWDSAESMGQMFEKFKQQYGIKFAEEVMKATYGDDWYNRMMNNVK